MVQKSCKNECICLPNTCFSGIVTCCNSSLFGKNFNALMRSLKLPPFPPVFVYSVEKNLKDHTVFRNFDKMRKRTLYSSIDSIQHNSQSSSKTCIIIFTNEVCHVCINEIEFGVSIYEFSC